jgi:hypothetical protein
MAEYDESEYFTDSQEEIAEREAQEALRRMVRTEIRRVQTGAADADIAEDIAREEEAQAIEERKRKPKWVMKIEALLTGDILLAEKADRAYHLLMLLGVVFLLSIFTIFGAFQQDLHRNTLQKEVALLKERAIRISEEKMQQCSHSAILRKLGERGIELDDPKNPPMVLK